MNYIALMLGLVLGLAGYVALVMLIARASGIGHRLDTPADDDEAHRPITSAEIHLRRQRSTGQAPGDGG